ncbi:PQQ-binding-like beta-propeller repeat protein [Streptomyces sp. NPDC057654]|uniref:outer membrane protein assembly factor BamB family protein n=1 Tax=Streptomyces sp. NPDC057654 TaxID=3346196 RepID=UPI00369CCC2A
MTATPVPAGDDTDGGLSRRSVLRLGGAGAAALAATSLLVPSAEASEVPEVSEEATAGRHGPSVTDLGPGIVGFSLMSGLLIGDTVYIGSRNLSPSRLAAFHLPTRKVTASTDLGPGKFVQGLAASPDGRYLYAGVVYHGDGDQPNLFVWDLNRPNVPAKALGRIPGLNVRRLTVAPDGMLYAVGMEADPGIWEIEPATGKITNIGVPDPGATQARAVSASATTVYFGAGSNLSGGGGASRASLFAVDRTTHKMRSILPKELAPAAAIRDLEVIGDRLYVGTEGGTPTSLFAEIDTTDPTTYTVLATEGKTSKLFRRHGDDVYFTAGEGVYRYATGAKKIHPVPHGDADLGELWGLDYWNGSAVVTSGAGFVGEIDLTAPKLTRTDLTAAGAPAGAELGMSVTAGGGRVYVGGNGSMDVHRLSTGKTVHLDFPGEAKDGVVVGRTLYTGQYSSQGIWTYDPRKGGGPHQAVALPVEQNRPQGVCWDPVHRRLLAGVQCDTEGGGAFAVYDPASGKVKVHVNPFDENQMVRAVTSYRGVAYLGGDNPYSSGPRGEIAAWDPVAGRQLWRLDLGQKRAVNSLIVRRGLLYCLCLKGEFFVIDVKTRAVVHRADLGTALVPGEVTFAMSRGRVYAASASTLMRFAPDTFAVSTVVGGLGGEWYGMPDLDADERGRLYTFRGRNLIQVTDSH